MLMTATIETLVAEQLATYFENQTMTPTLTELKAELTADLNEAALDQVQAGRTPAAAVAIAFADFGDIETVITQVEAENGPTTTEVEPPVMTVNENGVYVNGGRTLKADANGVSIGDGAVKADRNGLKLGKLVMNEDGISYGDQTKEMPDWQSTVAPFNLGLAYQDNLRLANEQQFSATELTMLTVSYRSARVKVLPTNDDSDDVIIREYMQPNNPAYYAHCSETGTNLTVTQGKVPFLIPLRVHVQVLVPASFTGDVTVASKSGTVLIAGLSSVKTLALKVASGNAELADLTVQTTTVDLASGSLKMGHVQVTDQCRLLVRSGRVRLAQVSAITFTVKATSGSVTGNDLIGAGDWQAHSGALRLAWQQLTGDLNLDAHSGAIKVSLPATASYRYELESHSGRITTPTRAIRDRVADGYQTGTVGANAQYQIHGRAHSSSIKLS